MIRLFILGLVVIMVSSSCNNSGNGEVSTDSSSGPNTPGMNNVNGNMPDTSNSINLNGNLPVDSSKLKDSAQVHY
ncbi:MAG: hypothetical protein ACM3VS_07615 [Candidatus Dadabacteria bacterium]